MCRFERSVVLDELVNHGHRDDGVSPCSRNISVHYCDDGLRTLDGGKSGIHRSAERNVAVLVHRRYLNHGDVARKDTAAVELLCLAQKDWNVVGPTCLHVFADIAAYKESLMEESALKTLFGVRSRTFGMEVMDAYVFQFAGFSAAAESLNEHLRCAGNTAQMNVVTTFYAFYSFVSRNEFNILHIVLRFMNFPNDKNSNFAVMKREKELQAFERLLNIMDDLREKCPWDRKQTMESLRPNTIEETYELCDAIMASDMRNVAKELGDVLLHIVFYAKIGSEKGEFDIADVCNLLCDKLVYRHPHVYGNVEVSGAGEVVQNWEQLKRAEKDGNKTVLSGVPVSLPSLIKAYRMQDKARAVGFDWQRREDVWDKVTEEIGELRAELSSMAEELSSEDRSRKEAARKKAEGELGDLIFSLVNAARLYDLNPDSALEMTNRKFRSRFTYIEMKARETGLDLKDMTLARMDELWEEAKRMEF